MNHRLATLIDRETATTAATRELDVDLIEPISAFSIQMRGLNNGSTPTATPAKMISKVELVDGSDLLWSLSGIQLEALELHDTGKLAYSERNFIDDNYCITVLEMRFGRHLWDEQLAFDPKQFKNPQLKITHNKASGGSAPDAGNLSVLAHVFDEKAVTPIGLLVNKEIFSYTLSANEHKYPGLPTDRVARKVMIQTLTAGKQPWENVNKVKLYTDQQKRIVINDVRMSDLLRCYANHVNPYFIETIRAHMPASAVTHYLMSTFDTKVVGAGILAAAAYYEGAASYGGSVGIEASAATEGDCIVSGKAPHGSFCIPLGKQDDIDDWFDATKVGSWTLDLTAGSGASGTAEILVQQLRKY